MRAECLAKRVINAEAIAMFSLLLSLLGHWFHGLLVGRGAFPSLMQLLGLLGRPRIGAPHRAPNMRRVLNPRPRDIRPIPGVMAESERVRTKVRMGRGRARGRGARPAQQ